VGCVAVRPMSMDEACEMKRLYAAPAARGAGVGRALVLAAIGAARRAGYRVMRLDTLPAMAAAQGLYRELGFEVTPPYYDSPVAGTLFMQKMLAPVGA
jgi:ribosomal protein S18 acetylase RimI-like enzyme